LGIVPLSGGSIRLFGRPVSSFSDWKKVGYVPQKTRSFSPLFPATVEEVIAMGRYEKRFFVTRERQAQVDRVIELFALETIRKRPIGELSGGELQRTMLARALVCPHDLLVLDEPTASLDPTIRAVFHDELERLNCDHGVTIMYITHDFSEIHDCATQLIYIDRKVVFDGTLKEFCASKDMTGYFGHHVQHHMCHQHRDE
jgi:zinc transport system ATP-binding protein